MFEIMMTVNMLLVLAQTFYLGVQWERHRQEVALKSEDDQTHE